jgi:hypothetical protein
LQPVAQLASNVAALVKIDVVLAAPQEPVRGHGQQQQPTRLQDPSHLAQSAEIVVDVLDDVEGRDQVECVIFKRQAVGARLRHLPQPAVVAVADRLQVHVDTLRVSETREVGQHRPGSTADVENPSPVGGARPEVPVEDREQDAAAADEPPVDILHPVVFPVELSLQISREPG